MLTRRQRLKRSRSWPKCARKSKGAAPKSDPCPLINPTDADAERLQATLNEKTKADLAARKARGAWAEEYTESKVLRIPQAVYSRFSKGSYASAQTRGLFRGGAMAGTYYRANEKLREQFGREVCQVRATSGGNYMADRVIVLTDKPQKPLPAAVWELSAQEKAEKAAERAHQYEALEAKRAAAGAVSVNGETGELAFK